MSPPKIFNQRGRGALKWKFGERWVGRQKKFLMVGLGGWGTIYLDNIVTTAI
jgi:hypothetical protein